MLSDVIFIDLPICRYCFFIHVIIFFFIFLKRSGGNHFFFLFLKSFMVMHKYFNLRKYNFLSEQEHFQLCQSINLTKSVIFNMCTLDQGKFNLDTKKVTRKKPKKKTLRHWQKHSNCHRYCLFHLLLKFRPKILLTFFTLNCFNTVSV